jgi:hypothetical protein
MNTHKQNKSRPSTQVLLATALAVAVVWLAGCQSTVHRQGDRAAGSAQATALEVQTQSQMVEATMAALNDLVYKPAADLKPQFESFSSALDRLVAGARQGGVTGSRLERSNAVYLAAWSKQLTTITNADVRSHSEARKIEVGNQFRAAQSQYAQAQGNLWSLVDYLQDVRRALSTDLTANGLQAVKPLVSTATTRVNQTRAALTQSQNSLTTLGSAMSSASGPGGK